MSSEAIALKAMPERYRFVWLRTYQPSPKNSVVNAVGMATRNGAEKLSQPHTTNETAALNNRKMPRKSIACSVRSESNVRQKRSRHEMGGGTGGRCGGGTGGLSRKGTVLLEEIRGDKGDEEILDTDWDLLASSLVTCLLSLMTGAGRSPNLISRLAFSAMSGAYICVAASALAKSCG